LLQTTGGFSKTPAGRCGSGFRADNRANTCLRKGGESTISSFGTGACDILPGGDAAKDGLARLRHLAAGLGNRSRRFLPRNPGRAGKKIIGADLWWMNITDKNIRHQLVIAGTVAHPAAL